jgi:hypothetical protein
MCWHSPRPSPCEPAAARSPCLLVAVVVGWLPAPPLLRRGAARVQRQQRPQAVRLLLRRAQRFAAAVGVAPRVCRGPLVAAELGAQLARVLALTGERVGQAGPRGGEQLLVRQARQARGVGGVRGAAGAGAGVVRLLVVLLLRLAILLRLGSQDAHEKACDSLKKFGHRPAAETARQRRATRRAAAPRRRRRSRAARTAAVGGTRARRPW